MPIAQLFEIGKKAWVLYCFATRKAKSQQTKIWVRDKMTYIFKLTFTTQIVSFKSPTYRIWIAKKLLKSLLQTMMLKDTQKEQVGVFN